MNNRTHTIDATGKMLGRVASQAAVFLLGKDKPDFERNTVAPTKVTIANCSKLHLNAKKQSEKKYISYTGYPGGLKSRSLAELKTRFGAREAVRRAVFGMLPKNKLRARIIKNLIVKE